MKKVCSHCGSENVRISADATWNKNKQEWELNNVYTGGDECDDCEGMTTIKTV